MGRLSIGAAITACVRFIGEAWSRAWGVMLLLVWLTAMLQVFAVLRPQWGLVSFFGAIALLFVNTAAVGALYRLRLEGDHPGDPGYASHPAGLQWGGLEWRVLAVNLLVGIVLVVLAVIGLFIWGVALGVAAQGNPADLQTLQSGSEADRLVALRHLMLGPGGVVTVIVLLPALFGVLYLALRLMVFTPFAADTRSFDVGKAWGLARGAMVVLLVTFLGILVTDFLVGAVGGFFMGLFAGVSGHGGEAKQWGGAAGQVLSAAINPPLFAGLALYVYRAQRADPGVAATFS